MKVSTTLHNSFTDCLGVHLRVTDSVVANIAKYPTGVRPLLVYY